MTYPVPTDTAREKFAIAVASGKLEDVALYLDTYGNDQVRVPLSRELKSIERSPLGWAALYGHIGMMELLLQRGANINQPSNQLDTPLMSAVIWHKLEAAQFLIRAGASLSPKDKLDRTALDYAVTTGIVNMIALLKQAELAAIAGAFTQGSRRVRKTPPLAKKINVKKPGANSPGL